MKGLKSILWGLFLAIGIPGLTFLSGVEWTEFVSPTMGTIIAGAVAIVLRFLTDTAVFRKE